MSADWRDGCCVGSCDRDKGTEGGKDTEGEDRLCVFVVLRGLGVSDRRLHAPDEHGARHVRIAVGGQNQMVYLPTTLAQSSGSTARKASTLNCRTSRAARRRCRRGRRQRRRRVRLLRSHDSNGGRGARAIAFVTMLRFPGLVLVTSPQSAAPITTIAALKGHIAGVTTAGSSSQMLLTDILQRNGVAADAVSITAIGSAATAIAALEHGKVDVGMVADPAFTLVHRRNPGVRVLADLRTAEGVNASLGTHAYPASVLYANGEWIRANHDTTERLARAITRTLQWMQRIRRRRLPRRHRRNFAEKTTRCTSRR